MSAEVFSTIRVPDNVRQKLKILSAQRNIPMYRLVEEWLATQRDAKEEGAHTQAVKELTHARRLE